MATVPTLLRCSHVHHIYNHHIIGDNNCSPRLSFSLQSHKSLVWGGTMLVSSQYVAMHHHRSQCQPNACVTLNYGFFLSSFLTCWTCPQCILLPCRLALPPSPRSPDCLIDLISNFWLSFSMSQFYDRNIYRLSFSLSLFCCAVTSFPLELMSQVTTWAPNLANL